MPKLAFPHILALIRPGPAPVIQPRHEIMITFKRLSMNRPGNSAPPKMEADPSRRPFSLRRGYVFTASGTRSAGFSGCRIAALSSLQSLAFLFQGGDHGRGRRQECRRYGRLESLRYATLNT